MKRSFSIISVALLALCFAAGCAKKDSVDTAKLEASFSTAEPTAKSEVDNAVAAVKAQDWAGATASLQKLAANVKLTEEQKKAVSDTLEQVGKMIKESADKAVGEASKALGDAQKSLGK
ncbi:MAG: hypothetical protein L0Y58_13645 [Verrucomicrobia subdivision 3 bacterium]|nr:hypothetical protein [Limisphaerales bacterium]